MSTTNRIADIARAELTDLRVSYARYVAVSLDSTGDTQRIANARANRILAAIKVVSAEVAGASVDAHETARLACQPMPSDTYEERTAQLDARIAMVAALDPIASHPAFLAMADDAEYLASHGIRRPSAVAR